MQPDLDKITQSMEELFARLTAAQELAPTAELRQQLGALQRVIGEGKSRFADEFQGHMAVLNQRIAAARQSAAETLQAVKKSRAQIAAAREAAKAPQPTAPSPPEPPVDPNLGQRLRQELLQRFGDSRKAPSDQHLTDREIWEDWGSEA